MRQDWRTSKLNAETRESSFLEAKRSSCTRERPGSTLLTLLKNQLKMSEN